MTVTQIPYGGHYFFNTLLLRRGAHKSSDQRILAEQKEKSSDFRLKKDDDGQNEHFGNRSKERPEDRHVGRHNQYLNQVQRHYPGKDLHSDRSAHQLIQFVQDVRNKRDLKKIDQSNRYDPGNECHGRSVKVPRLKAFVLNALYGI